MSPSTTPRELADGKLLVDEPAEHVLRLTISNPAKHNALDHPILDAISATLAELTSSPASPTSSPASPTSSPDSPTSPDSRTSSTASPTSSAGIACVIVTGAHGVFSAGYDIGELPDADFEERAERLIAHPFTEAIDALEALPFPTLAVLPGHTIGGGLELALTCDLRVAAEGIKLGMPPAKLGLVYSHMGLKRFLDAIGAPRTRELFLLGRHIDSSTALDWGLVNRVVPDAELESTGLDFARTLASNAPLSQVGNKRVIATLLDSERRLPDDVEQELIELRRSSFASLDMREAILAFAEKRTPRWRGE